jgi:hypothetical protein
MVAESKAYCPDCGAPMDAEQDRFASSAFDIQMKTENISPTTQFRLLEELNQSTLSNIEKAPQGTKPAENKAPVSTDPVFRSSPPAAETASAGSNAAGGNKTIILIALAVIAVVVIIVLFLSFRK